MQQTFVHIVFLCFALLVACTSDTEQVKISLEKFINDYQSTDLARQLSGSGGSLTGGVSVKRWRGRCC